MNHEVWDSFTAFNSSRVCRETCCYIWILPLEAYFNEDLVLYFDLNYWNDTVYVPPFGVCAMADDSPVGVEFDSSFDPALRFSEAFKASISEINGPLSHPVCWTV